MDDTKTDKKKDQKEEIPEKPVEKPEETSDVSKQLDDSQKVAEDFKNKYYRALADYQNLERRVREERTEMIKVIQARVIEDFLPFLDTLNQAEIFVKDQGLKMVKDSFLQRLQELGVKEIELMGKEFDPHSAEAIDTIEGEKDNVVVEVLRKGYEFNGKILRIGQVKVSKKNEKKVEAAGI